MNCDSHVNACLWLLHGWIIFQVLICSKFLVMIVFSLWSLIVTNFAAGPSLYGRHICLSSEGALRANHSSPFAPWGSLALKQARGLSQRRAVLQRKRRWQWKHAVNKTFSSSLRNRSKIAEIGGGGNQVENRSKNRRIGVSWQPCTTYILTIFFLNMQYFWPYLPTALCGVFCAARGLGWTPRSW